MEARCAATLPPPRQASAHPSTSTADTPTAAAASSPAAVDSALFAGQAWGAGAVLGAAAAVVALAGLADGTGQRLGDALLAAAPDARAPGTSSGSGGRADAWRHAEPDGAGFAAYLARATHRVQCCLAMGLLWGWQPRETAPSPASPCASLTESGLEAAIRRIATVVATAPTHTFSVTSSGDSRVSVVAVPDRCDGIASMDKCLLPVLASEALPLLTRLRCFQDGFKMSITAPAAHTERFEQLSRLRPWLNHVGAAHLDLSLTSAAIADSSGSHWHRDSVGYAGVSFVPLAGGHNASWTRLEAVAIVRSLLGTGTGIASQYQ